jgi:RimJ/RimL family protein N-acetyltransferase
MAGAASDQIRIRFLLKTDLEAFKSLRLEALREHPEAFGSDYEEDSRQPESFWIDRVEKSVDNPYGCAIIAESGTELAGMVGVWRQERVKRRHCAGIWGVYVRPAYRGQRLMDRMIGQAIDWCRGNQVRIVSLTVGTHNGPAIRCYLRCGFTVYGVSPEEIHVGGRFIEELLMARKI